DAEADVALALDDPRVRERITYAGDGVIGGGVVVHQHLEPEIAFLREHRSKAIEHQLAAVVVGDANGDAGRGGRHQIGSQSSAANRSRNGTRAVRSAVRDSRAW